MKKSTIVTLIVSILLIALGFLLVGLGISSSYDSVEYRFGRTIYFQTSYTNHSLESRLLTSFGQMSFILGIAGVFLFAYLAIRNPRTDRRVHEAGKVHDEPRRNHMEHAASVTHQDEVKSVDQNGSAASEGTVMPGDGAEGPGQKTE